MLWRHAICPQDMNTHTVVSITAGPTCVMATDKDYVITDILHKEKLKKNTLNYI